MDFKKEKMSCVGKKGELDYIENFQRLNSKYYWDEDSMFYIKISRHPSQREILKVPSIVIICGYHLLYRYMHHVL